MQKPMPHEIVTIRNRLARKFGEDVAQSTMIALLVAKTTSRRPTNKHTWFIWAWLWARKHSQREKHKERMFTQLDANIEQVDHTFQSKIEARDVLKKRKVKKLAIYFLHANVDRRRLCEKREKARKETSYVIG